MDARFSCRIFGLAIAFLLMFVDKSLASTAESVIPERKGLLVLKQDRFVYVRSVLSEHEDVVIPVTISPSNGQIIFGQTFLVPADTPMDVGRMNEAGWKFHAGFDDATPWCLNGTYIGANHGANEVIVVTSPSHGLSDVDLGSIWKDAAGAVFYVIEIAGEDQVHLLSENIGDYPRWKFTRSIEGTELTNGTTGRILPVSAPTLSQLCPACRINSQRFVVDGNKPLEEGVPTSCAVFEVVEDYDIIAPDSVLDAVKKAAGHRVDFVSKDREAVLSNHIVYQFQSAGACLIEHRATALRDFDLSYMGFIQSSPLQAAEGDRLVSHIPKTTPFTDHGIKYDFEGLQDLSEPPVAPLIFSTKNGNVADAADLPDRFIQILQSGDRRIGFAMGYSSVRGLTKPSLRANNTESPLFIHTSRKTYPAAIDRKAGPMRKGTEVECVAYRQYFDPRSQPGATCVYGHMEGEDYFVYADFHSPMENFTLRIPEEFRKRRFEVLEKSDSVRIASDGAVSGEGVPMAVQGDRGTVVLRFEK